MAITPTTLARGAGVASAVAGLIFIGVQINHPYLDAASVTTTQVVVRDSLKVLMAVLALAGVSDMYLFQVRKTGVLAPGRRAAGAEPARTASSPGSESRSRPGW